MTAIGHRLTSPWLKGHSPHPKPLNMAQTSSTRVQPFNMTPKPQYDPTPSVCLQVVGCSRLDGADLDSAILVARITLQCPGNASCSAFCWLWAPTRECRGRMSRVRPRYRTSSRRRCSPSISPTPGRKTRMQPLSRALRMMSSTMRPSQAPVTAGLSWDSLWSTYRQMWCGGGGDLGTCGYPKARVQVGHTGRQERRLH